MSKILWIRHGATKGNLEKRYVGLTDEEITEQSKIQLLQMRKEHKDLFSGINKVYVSPMKRCLQTADILFPNQDYISVAELKEMNFGEFEYKNYKQLSGNEEYQKYIDSGGALPFPGGESREEFCKRVISGFLLTFPDKDSPSDQCVAYVVHGGTIMAVLDAYSQPHKDYFEWQLGAGRGILVDVDSSNHMKVIQYL